MALLKSLNPGSRGGVSIADASVRRGGIDGALFVARCYSRNAHRTPVERYFRGVGEVVAYLDGRAL